MLLKLGLSMIAISSSTVAQSLSPSRSGTAASASATHTVAVGADGLNFSPNQLNASVGDIVEFRFYPRNHSVARAAFKQPCIPIEDTGPGLVGFWSGFQPLASPSSNPPVFRVPINDTEPVFFYCSAPNACYDGMVGVINPNSTFTFDIQFAYSQNATEEFSPLEYFPVEAAPSRTPTATGAPTGAAPASTNPPSATPPEKKTLSTGAIVGIVIGALVVFALAASLLYTCGKQRGMGDMGNLMMRSSNPPEEKTKSTYTATSPGLSEANYPNMRDSGFVPVDMNASGRFSPQSYGSPQMGAESYRSFSPQIDERTGMLQSSAGNMDSRYQAGQPSPGISGHTASLPNSPGLPSPPYTQRHEMEQRGNPGLIPYHPDTDGPHEMAVPSRNPSATTPPAQPRPFSYMEDQVRYKPDAKG